MLSAAAQLLLLLVLQQPSSLLPGPVLCRLLSAQEPAPLLNYQDLQDLKHRIAGQLVEVEVTLEVPVGVDPSVAPVLIGQAVCLDGSPKCRIVASGFLAENAASVRVRSLLQPEWTKALVVQGEGPLPLIELVPKMPFECAPTTLAPSLLQQPGTYVFSVDDPVSQFPNVFFAEIAQRAEPPLAAYLLTSVGLPLSGPLFSSDGRLVAMNLRGYSPASQHKLAVTAEMVRRFLSPSRRPPAFESPFFRRIPSGTSVSPPVDEPLE